MLIATLIATVRFDCYGFDRFEFGYFSIRIRLISKMSDSIRSSILRCLGYLSSECAGAAPARGRAPGDALEVRGDDERRDPGARDKELLAACLAQK